MTRTTFGIGAGALALFMGASTAALAQATPPAAPADTGAITVYATRTATNIQKTPLQVTPLTAQKLKDSNANQLRDITYLAPSVRYTSDSGAEETAITMRGIGASAAGGAGPGVQVYEEEVPLAGTALNLQPYDVADVEVLQGPQGTTFGRNTLAGAVLIEPVLPSFQQNGYIKGSYGSYNYAEIEGGFNITAIPDVLAFRLAGEYERRDGDVKALSPTGGPSTVTGSQNNLNDANFRFSVLFTPTAQFKNVLTFDYRNENITGQPAVIDNPLGRLAGADALAPLFGLGSGGQLLGYPGTAPAAEALALADAQKLAACHHLCIDYGPLTQQNLQFIDTAYRLFNTTTFELSPNVTLKNIFGWQQDANHLAENSTGGFAPSLGGTNPFQTFLAAGWFPIRTITEDFQVDANLFDNRVQTIVGVFYTNSNSFGTDGSLINDLIAGAAGAKSSSVAVYTNVVVGITDKLKFRGGFRYTWDQNIGCTSPSVFDLGGPFPAPGTPPGTSESCFANVGPNPLTQSALNTKNSSAPTWSVGLDYQATPDTFLYVVSRRGYRAPALNSAFTDPCLSGGQSIYAPGSTHNPGDPADAGRAGFCANDSGVGSTFNRTTGTHTSTTGDASGRTINLQPLGLQGSETLTDVEVGIRSSWMMGGWRAKINVDYFHYWDNNVAVLTQWGSVGPANYDLLGAHTAGTAFGGVTATEGSISADGVQGDFQVMPTQDLTVDFNVSWLNQKGAPVALPIAALLPGVNAAGIANILASTNTGQLLSPTPPWSYNISARYVMPWHPLDGDLVINYNYFWTQGWFDQNKPVPGYDLHNLRIDWNNIGRSNVSAGVWVRNLLNKDYIISVVNIGGGVNNHGDPRMIGVDLSYKFH